MNPTPSQLEALALVSLPTLITEADTPTDWLVEGLVPAGETWLIYGPSHSGKTYALLDLGLAVAYGRPWLGRFPVPQAVPVIYAPSEGRAGIGKRVYATIDHHYRYDGAEEFYLWDGHLNLADSTSRSLPMLAKAIEATGAGLVIVDVLRDATPGVREEGAEMGDALGRLRDLAHYTGATLLVAHHAGKDLDKGARGHSSLRDKADQEVLIREASTLTDKGGTFATQVAFENKKNRNEDNWGRIDLDLRVSREGARAPVVVGEWLSERPDIVNQAGLSMLEAIEASTTIVNPSSTERGCRFADLAEVLGITKQAVTETAKALESQGLADIDRSEKAHLIRLTPRGLAAIDNQPTTAQAGPARTTTNPAAPYRVPGVVDGRLTTIEQLRDLAEQEARYEAHLGDVDEVADNREPTPEELEQAGAALLRVLDGGRTA